MKAIPEGIRSRGMADICDRRWPYEIVIMSRPQFKSQRKGVLLACRLCSHVFCASTFLLGRHGRQTNSQSLPIFTTFSLSFLYCNKTKISNEEGAVAEWLSRMTRNHIPSGAHVRIMPASFLLAFWSTILLHFCVI